MCLKLETFRGSFQRNFIRPKIALSDAHKIGISEISLHDFVQGNSVEKWKQKSVVVVPLKIYIQLEFKLKKRVQVKIDFIKLEK